MRIFGIQVGMLNLVIYWHMLLQHISGDITQKSGVSLCLGQRNCGCVVCFDPFQLSSDSKCTVYLVHIQEICYCTYVNCKLKKVCVKIQNTYIPAPYKFAYILKITCIFIVLQYVRTCMASPNTLYIDRQWI